MDTNSPSANSFSAIDINEIQPGKIINFEIYLKFRNRFSLYKEKNHKINHDEINFLKDKRINTLYLLETDHPNFVQYLEENLTDLMHSDLYDLEIKVKRLYKSANIILRDLFNNPGSKKHILRSKQILGHTVDFLVNHPDSLNHFIKIKKSDYVTFTHSVNVCNFLIFFSQRVGIENKNTLIEIAEGGLLHDLGKINISPKIINKKGKLSPSEWRYIKKHPSDGVEIAKKTREIGEVGLVIIGQHHEKVHGKGYPIGLKGSELSVYANMVSIVDVFDAVTTNRPYSIARDFNDAIKFLLSIKDDFDSHLLSEFIELIPTNGE